MNDTIRIPTAIQLRIDDVAWHNGDDDRYHKRPSRSGLPRQHHPDDYPILNELGRALNMKIGCSLVLGEWDKNNRLRGVPHVTWDEAGWDRAAQIDLAYAEKCRDNLENSEYIDYVLHGLLHGYYDNGTLITENQYYPFFFDREKGAYTAKRTPLPADEFRRQLELFFAICDDWGFTKKITAFASPCSNFGTPEENAEFAEILKSFGILHWKDVWSDMDGFADVSRGLICEKCIVPIPWDAYAVNPAYLPLYYTENNPHQATDFTSHWTNYIRFNPENNMEFLSAWTEYYLRQAEVFGVMLSRDIPFAASQALYNAFAKTEITDGKCIVDLKNVDAKGAIALKNEFYVSMKNGTEPKGCEGGTIELYETKQNFKTYKITRENTDKLIITL